MLTKYVTDKSIKNCTTKGWDGEPQVAEWEQINASV